MPSRAQRRRARRAEQNNDGRGTFTRDQEAARSLDDSKHGPDGGDGGSASEAVSDRAGAAPAHKDFDGHDDLKDQQDNYDSSAGPTHKDFGCEGHSCTAGGHASSRLPSTPTATGRVGTTMASARGF